MYDTDLSLTKSDLDIYYLVQDIFYLSSYRLRPVSVTTKQELSVSDKTHHRHLAPEAEAES